MILCERCGHRAQHHTGLGPGGYTTGVRLACLFETDRYEVCVCDHLELDHDTALMAVVKADGGER